MKEWRCYHWQKNHSANKNSATYAKKNLMMIKMMKIIIRFVIKCHNPGKYRGAAYSILNLRADSHIEPSNSLRQIDASGWVGLAL